MQTSYNLVLRLGAVAAALGGLLWTVKAFYDRNDAPPWPTDVSDALLFVVPLLFLVGLAGLYARCRGRLGEWEALSSAAFVAGVVGQIGCVLGLITATLDVGPSWWLFFFGFFLTNLGLVFLGNSIVQTGALPRWRALPLLIGSLGILLILVSDPPNSPLGIYPSLALWMTYGLAWAALGYVLWSYQDEPVRQTASVR